MRVYIIKNNGFRAARIIRNAHDQALFEYFEFREHLLHDEERFKRSDFISRRTASKKSGGAVRSRVIKLQGGMPGAPLAFWREFNKRIRRSSA